MKQDLFHVLYLFAFPHLVLTAQLCISVHMFSPLLLVLCVCTSAYVSLDLQLSKPSLFPVSFCLSLLFLNSPSHLLSIRHVRSRALFPVCPQPISSFPSCAPHLSCMALIKCVCLVLTFQFGWCLVVSDVLSCFWIPAIFNL